MLLISYLQTFLQNSFKIIIWQYENHFILSPFKKHFYMDSLAEIESVLKTAKEKKKEMILKAIDGRTQRSVSVKTGIEETKLSRWINGDVELEPKELANFNKHFGTAFTLSA